MKSGLAFGAVFVLVGTFVLTAVTCAFSPAGHCDFSLRMNEIGCLRQGVNPFDVWHEDVLLPPYCSNLPKKSVPPECTEMVNAYVPWEYTLMLPLSYLPRSVSWVVYCVLMGLIEVLIFIFGYRLASDGALRSERMLATSASLLLVSYLLWSNAAVGNFAIHVLLASILIAWCLTRQRDVLAGFCWAFAMIKPQSAILFAIPLLMRKKWVTCFVAVGTCLVASFVPKIMCHASLLDLLLQGPAANAELFLGCGTYPRFLMGTFDGGAEIGIGLSVGALLCGVMTWMVRQERDWIVLLMPAAICAASWTYTQAYSHVMGWFVAFVLVRELIRFPSSRFLWALMALAVFSLSRWFLAWHGICSFAGWAFPMSEYAFRCVDSLNSTLSLAIAMAFCMWKRPFPGEYLRRHLG